MQSRGSGRAMSHRGTLSGNELRAGPIVDRLGDRGASTDSIPYPQTDKLVAVHAPEDNLMWGDDEGPLVFCTNLLRDADQ